MPKMQLTALSLAIAMLAAGRPAIAQEETNATAQPPAQTPDAADSKNTLPAVQVSGFASGTDKGMKLTQDTAAGALGSRSVLDTPFSMTVVGSAEIAERGARSIGQIFANDPAVYTPTSSLTTDWWGTQIRGLGVRNYYIDGIPTLLYWGGDFATEAVESVTALKGLSGFMYGFGEPGGALSYELKRPTAKDSGSVMLGWRNPGLLSAHLDLSRHLGDDVALRVNLLREHGRAYNDSEIDRTLASAALDVRLTPSLTWTNTFVYEHSRNTGEPFLFYIDAYDFAGSQGRLPKVTYRYDDINVDNSYYDATTSLASTGLNWQIDEQWKLSYQLGYSRKDHQSNKSFAYLLNEAGDYEGEMYNFAGRLGSLFTQLVLQGQLRTGPVSHEIVAGLGIQRSTDRWSEFYWENDFNGNIFQTQTFRVTRTPDFTLSPVSSDVRQRYAFVSDTLDFGTAWQAIVGLRYNNYRNKDLDGDPTVDSGYSVSKASPTLALIYRPDEATRLYGSYVQALEPGTRVDAPYANAGDLLGATVSKQFEIGAKHERGALAYTAALFRVDRANQRDVLRDGLRYLTQDGQVRYTGLDLSGTWQTNSQFSLGLGLLWLDGEILKTSPESAELLGHTPGLMSKWQAVANTRYRVAAIPGLTLQANVRYFGSTYTSDTNLWRLPGRTITNAGFSYDWRAYGQPMKLIGNLYNVFNSKYWTDANPGEARNAALSLNMSF